MESPSLCPDHIGRIRNCSLPECALVELTAAHIGGWLWRRVVCAERMRLRVRSNISQVAQQTRERHFPISGLEAALDRGLNAALGLGVPGALAEEIRIATELLGWRERDGIDSVLDRDMSSGREAFDPMSERSDEATEHVGGQCSIDPAVALSQLRVVVLRTQHDLKRSGATHDAREVLGCAAAREQTERRLHLTKD